VPPAECSILVLEDEPGILRLVTATLESAGLGNVNATCSIAEARQSWASRNGKFQLFISDFSLPDGSATAFIKELLQQKPSLPVILTSGFGEDMLDLDGMPRGVTLLQKPFRPSELRQVIVRLLQLPENKNN
jgi:DNA-binding NtrC family response regulator